MYDPPGSNRMEVPLAALPEPIKTQQLSVVLLFSIVNELRAVEAARTVWKALPATIVAEAFVVAKLLGHGLDLTAVVDPLSHHNITAACAFAAEGRSNSPRSRSRNRITSSDVV